ncbi:MAG: carbohydrate ABC transporter permease [Phycisphaerales bacterium]|nr:carbohydrate ABC transporter permease [Phycisphaerales bacterium]
MNPPTTTWLRRTLLAAGAALFLLPLVWMLTTSLKPAEQAASGRVTLLPWPITNGVPDFGAGIGERLTEAARQGAANYDAVWSDPSITFPIYLRNTLIVAALSVVGMTLSSAIVAYGLSRIRWRGRGMVLASVLVTMMIPFPVLMAPLYIVFRELGWIGSLKPLWVPAWFGGAFNIFLLRQFYMGLPRELDEAARIDGLGHWGTFWRVIVPLSRPALAVVALFHFIYVWNDFLAPLIFLTHREDFTLALGLQLYQSKAGLTPWNLLMAASSLVFLPVLILFLLAQRAFVQGVAAEGVKG